MASEEKTSLVASEGNGKIAENQDGIEFVTKDGHIIQTIDNIVKALSEDKDYRGMLAYNCFTHRIVFQRKPWWDRAGCTDAFEDVDESYVRMELESRYGLSSERKVDRAIQIVANAQKFHPIIDLLESLEWDGVDRIGDMFPKYLGAERCEYTTEITKNWLMGAVNRVYCPGCKYDAMLVLIDDIGGGGKSTMARFLALADEYFSDDIPNFDDKDYYEKLAGHWIIEIGEMQAVANAKSIESLKAFLSRQKDNYRIKYGKHTKDYLRQCVFIGTSNDTQFLPQDSSGYRRFMPLRVDKGKAEKHPLEDEMETREYINQVWAQAMVIYREGKYSLELSERIRDQLESVANEYAPEDMNYRIIENWLESTNENKVCTGMIYEKALHNDDYTKAKQWEIKEISRIMDRMPGWVKHPTQSHQVRFERYGRVSGWDRIETTDVSESPQDEWIDTADNPFL